MKSAVILFHKNIKSYYPQRWVNQCTDSIIKQTYQDFTIYENDYGSTSQQLLPQSKFFDNEFENHAQSHNFLLDQVFSDGFDCAFNINLDDYYDLNRFAIQIQFMERGIDVCSSNFIHIDQNGNTIRHMEMSRKNIKREFKRGNNIVAHPAVCYSKKFWTNCSKLIPSEIPKDDFNLWKRSINRFKFLILNDYLLYYRIHNNQICKPKKSL